MNDDIQIEIGIDEAGRGPVLGPLVYGCVWWPADCSAEMQEKYGFKDSKQLTAEERAQMFEQIKQIDDKHFGWAVAVTLPEEMSNEMLSLTGLNLNQLSYNSSAKLLKGVLEKGFKVKRVLLDQLGPPKHHVEMLRKLCGPLLSQETILISESKADDKYQVVSAASICAKVTRDHLLENWKFAEEASGEIKIDNNFGCGYPGDSLSKKWLQDNFDSEFGFPQIVRFSWATSKTIIDSKKCGIEWNDPKIDDGKYQPKISAMFNSKANLENQRGKTNPHIKLMRLTRKFEI